MPSLAEMWQIIQEQARQLELQRAEIEALKRGQQPQQAAQRQAQDAAAELARTAAEVREAGAEVQRAAATAEVQRAAAAEAQRIAAESVASVTSVATASIVEGGSAGGGWWERTSVGGYGELHYEGGARDQIDFHRFVLFFGHEFNSDIRFFSELEVEHAWSGEGRPGEVELEQAYVQLDLSDQHQFNAGIMLVPTGILNETHEPPTFFGVERNAVETNIIPTTWWEGGVGLSGNFGASGIAYNLLLTSGLNVPRTGANAFRVRNGRQKVGSAVARAPAVSGELTYTGIAGLELAASGHYEADLTQGLGDPITGEDVPGLLVTTHANARFGGFGLRALYSSWWIDGAGAEAIGRDRQTGYFIEPSYRFPLDWPAFGGEPSELGVFYRYSWWDNNAGMGSLGLATAEHSAGINFWPHPNVVFKLDYLYQETGMGQKTDRFDLGVGYQF